MLDEDLRRGIVRQLVASFDTIQSEFKRQSIKPLKRHSHKCRKKPFIAYDLETTLISEGTPSVLYITAYGENYKLSEIVDKSEDILSLSKILEREFLTSDRHNYRYIAWNGNGFDVFFVARALLLIDDIILRPYLTRSKNLRGMKVIGVGPRKGWSWEFLDGMAMTGLDTVKTKLEKFVGLFAPDFPKLDLDFDKQEFDATNKNHVAYADRDSEALYFAMCRANEIAEELTGNQLQPTLGNLGIKYFQSMMPENILCWGPNEETKGLLYGPAKRGGYCWIRKQYKGPIWKYDLNQAYAAAMRDCKLPAGTCFPTDKFEQNHSGIYHVVFSREKKTRVPFYYRDLETNVGYFTDGFEAETWLLSSEIDHLKDDSWTVKILEGFYWDIDFNMKDMVDELERLRFTDPGGPSGPLGTMVKTLANSAYGKTMEQLEGLELVMSKTCPEGYQPYAPEIEELDNIYFKEGEPLLKNYHCPQIGAFVTAHVRLLVRDAALGAEDKFLYADTDCVAFSAPVDHLQIDARSYGAWKEESAGDHYVLIGKKIYYGEDGKVVHAKGLHVRDLRRIDFDKWLETGKPPSQTQTQRQNFVKFLGGDQMFRDLRRRGTNVSQSSQIKIIGGEFFPLQKRKISVERKMSMGTTPKIFD